MLSRARPRQGRDVVDVRRFPYVLVFFIMLTVTAGIPILTNIFKAEMKKSGAELSNNLCPHFAMSRVDIFNVVRWVAIHLLPSPTKLTLTLLQDQETQNVPRYHVCYRSEQNRYWM